MTIVASIALALAALSGILMYGHAPLAATLLVVLPVVTLALSYRFRVCGYTLTSDAILIERGGWSTHLPLAGLRAVEGDAEAMGGSLRLFGNGGLFALTGLFWNRRIGRYRAYATDPSRAVILRYVDRKIVITPHDPQQFIMRARTALKHSATIASLDR